VYVQGASLKTVAALLVRLSNSPISMAGTSGPAGVARMDFKGVAWVWLVSWSALAVVSTLVIWAASGLPPSQMFPTGGLYALPLSGVPVVGALIGLLVRHRAPDRGRWLAIWIAMACTVWIMLTSIPMTRARLMGDVFTESAKTDLGLFTGFGGTACVIWIINAFLYFAEPRIGPKRAAVGAACAVAVVSGVSIVMVITSQYFVSAVHVGALILAGFLFGQLALLAILLTLAAIRWVRAGYAVDRSDRASAGPGSG
jgi:hypothetical protein